MSKFKVGDRVKIMTSPIGIEGTIIKVYHCIFNEAYYDIVVDNTKNVVSRSESILKLIDRKEEDYKMSNEEKELKIDVEILLNIYLSNREMNKKEIKRFSERHFDVIEKQNAKKILKRRSK